MADQKPVQQPQQPVDPELAAVQARHEFETGTKKRLETLEAAVTKIVTATPTQAGGVDYKPVFKAMGDYFVNLGTYLQTVGK